MKNIDKKIKINKIKNNVKTYIVPSLKQEKIIIKSNFCKNLSTEQIIRKALNHDKKGEILEASKYYQYLIHKGLSDPKIFCNYGIILRKQGKLKRSAELHRAAIKIEPNSVEAYYNLSNTLKELGEIKEAEISLRKAIKIKPLFAEAFNNLCSLLKNKGNLKEAKELIIQALKIKPNYAIAHYNYGTILKDIGNIKEAEISLRKAIRLNPDMVSSYYILSTINPLNNAEKWQNNLFEEKILNKRKSYEIIDIYFARANILHANRKYKESAKYLIKANNIKYNSQKSEFNYLINKSKSLQLESFNTDFLKTNKSNSPESIFIIGMPRSGSTLIESILSMNMQADDLGETNILEDSYFEWKYKRNSNRQDNLAEIYWEKANYHANKYNIKTNKNLYNYLYTGIILNNIPNSKIIHCFRNPLDNILSIYRAHFAKENIYCSSLTECSNIYLNTEKIINEYKIYYRTKIYDLNYDLLVNSPENEIRKLISWLGWKWNKSYLSPHLNRRVVLTASNIQVRSPINSKSTGGWNNYQEMLKPAINIISKNPKYIDLKNI